jgi:hypothetical protein
MVDQSGALRKPIVSATTSFIGAIDLRPRLAPAAAPLRAAWAG